MGERRESIRGLAERVDCTRHGFADRADGPVEVLDGIAELIAVRLGGRDTHLVVAGNRGGDIAQQDARGNIGQARGGPSGKPVPVADDLEEPAEQPVRERHAGAHV
jgi:hypothetical protein